MDEARSRLFCEAKPAYANLVPLHHRNRSPLRKRTRNCPYSDLRRGCGPDHGGHGGIVLPGSPPGDRQHLSAFRNISWCPGRTSHGHLAPERARTPRGTRLCAGGARQGILAFLDRCLWALRANRTMPDRRAAGDIKFFRDRQTGGRAVVRALPRGTWRRCALPSVSRPDSAWRWQSHLYNNLQKNCPISAARFCT